MGSILQGELQKLLRYQLKLMTKEIKLKLSKGCSGRIHEFFYNSSDFYQMKSDGSMYWSLPITNPFHLASFISFCGSVVVPPVCYAAIFKYKVFSLKGSEVLLKLDRGSIRSSPRNGIGSILKKN